MEKNIVWTRFNDMHSGGHQKLEFAIYYINAPEKEAKIIFYNRFGRNPYRITCTCCGEDYCASEYDSLEEATAFDRNCKRISFRKDNGEMIDGRPKYDGTQESFVIDGHPVDYKYIEEPNENCIQTWIPFTEYINNNSMCIISNSDIKENERSGELPIEGYVWQD